MRFLSIVLATAAVSAALFAQAPAPKAQVAPAKPAVAAPKPVAAAQPKPAAPKPPPAPKPGAMAKAPTTDEEQAVYALGLSMYNQLVQFDFSPAEVELLKRALTDAANKTPAGKLEDWGPKINTLVQARRVRVTERQKTASVAFLAKCATEPFNTQLPSGIVYREITAGTGDSPKPTDTVKVHYRGTLIDGTEFDSSYKRNEPAEFALTNVIKCWTEGLQKMKPGGKSRLVCPSDLAYGDQGRPSIPPAAVLVFEIELIAIVTPPTPAAPPAK